MTNGHLPHIVWVRYLGSRRFCHHFKGPMEDALKEVVRVRKVNKTIAETYVLPEGLDVELWNQRSRAEYPRP
jgi:hypothetical protein